MSRLTRPTTAPSAVRKVSGPSRKTTSASARSGSASRASPSRMAVCRPSSGASGRVLGHESRLEAQRRAAAGHGRGERRQAGSPADHASRPTCSWLTRADRRRGARRPRRTSRAGRRASARRVSTSSRCSIRRTPSTKKTRAGPRRAGGRIASQAARSTRMSTVAAGSSASFSWMAASYSAAQGSRRKVCDGRAMTPAV